MWTRGSLTRWMIRPSQQVRWAGEHMGLGAQSSPLADSFGRKHNYLRISLTERCNLRCQYCMPEEGVPLTPDQQLLSTQEVVKLSKLFVQQMGVTKIRLTGGEPLVRRDLVDIVRQLDQLRQDGLQTIAMTTNAVALNAKRCEALKNAGLNAVNISLDSLVKVKYELITRRVNTFDAVMRNLGHAMQCGFRQPIKINCVIMRRFNDDELIDFVELTKDSSVDVRFIEYMPFDGNKWKSDKLVPYEHLLKQLRTHYGPQLVQVRDQHGGHNATSRPYRVHGYQGQIGFITSMSNDFCSTCNRLRITADGNLKICLFGNEELSLRDAMRRNCTDAQLMHMIQTQLLLKKAKHADDYFPSARAWTLFAAGSILERPDWQLHRKQSVRQLSCDHGAQDQLSHVNSQTGQSEMVDVSRKQITRRVACARGKVMLGAQVFQLVRDNQMKKGDVLGVAKIAGMQAAKQTAHLIPLCHPLALEQVHVDIVLNANDHSAEVSTITVANHRTGVEMEALTGVSVACLTIYDMCKAVSKHIRITDIRLVSKSGGKSDFSE